jgi:hypothetical protein
MRMVMSEQAIEATVYQRTEALDRNYMAKALTEAQYRAELAKLDAWAKAQRAARNAPDV